MALITAVWASSLSELIFRLHIFIRRLSTSLITVYCTTARTVSSSQTTASSPGSGTRAVPRVSNWYCSSYSSLEKDFAWTTFTYTVLFVSLNVCIYGSSVDTGGPSCFLCLLSLSCLLLNAAFSAATCFLAEKVRALLFSGRCASVLRWGRSEKISSLNFCLSYSWAVFPPSGASLVSSIFSFKSSWIFAISSWTTWACKLLMSSQFLAYC